MASSWARTLAFLLAGSVPSASLARGYETTEAKILTLLQREEDASVDLESAVVALGPEATKTLFEALGGRLTIADGRTLRPREREQLTACLRAWPEGEVATALLGAARAPSTPSRQLLALRLFGDFAGSDSLEDFLALLQEIPRTQLRHASVREGVRKSLARILRRDRGGYAVCGRWLANLDRVELEILMEACKENGHGESLPILEALLKGDTPLVTQALDALGHHAPWDPSFGEGRAAQALSFFLGSADAAVRRQAAVSLGRLREAEYLPELVQLLSDPEPRVRSGALWSLREVTGFPWEEDPERWQNWLRQEEVWLEDEAPDLLSNLARSDRARSIEALRILSAHRGMQRYLSEDLCRLLEHDDPLIVARTSDTLSRLDDRCAVPTWIGLLEDPREQVRDAALRSLRAVTRETFGDRPEDWRNWLQRL